jgi:predicted transcriptional regulator
MGTVLHVQVGDDVARRIDAVAARKATSRSAIVRAMIAGPGLEEYERSAELAMCAYLPEGRFTVMFREYGVHNPRPEQLSLSDPDSAIAVVVDSVLYSMYIHYGARYREGPAVKRIRDRKRAEDIAAGHDSPVPL